MRLKTTFLLLAGWYGFLWYLGYYYLAWDNQLMREFFDVGWNNYEGPSLSSSENQYYGIWVLSGVVSIIALRGVFRKPTTFGIGLLSSNGFFTLIYVGLWLWDGDASMQETQVFWTVGCLLQLSLCGILLVEESLKQQLRGVLLGQFLAYVFLIGLGVYYWQWDLQLLKEREMLGFEHHNEVMIPEGRSVKVPEMRYHFVLLLAATLSLLFSFLTATSNKWWLSIRFAAMGLLLYASIVYFNGYTFEMAETRYWWMGWCGSLALLHLALFWKDNANSISSSVGYQSNVLDDLSHLEDTNDSIS